MVGIVKIYTFQYQGHNEVRWHQGKEKFGAPMFEPEIFRKHMYCIEESTCEWRLFGAPCCQSAPPAVIPRLGNCAPFPPRYAPVPY